VKGEKKETDLTNNWHKPKAKRNIKMVLELLIIILFILLTLTILYALYYYGLFSNIEIKSGKSPYPFNRQLVLFKMFKGAVKDIGPNFTKLSYLLMPYQSSSLVPICIQYRRLNSAESKSKVFKFLIGVVMEEENEELKSQLLLKNYKMILLPTAEHVVSATFPNKGSISVVIALNRVYPLLEAYITVIFIYLSIIFKSVQLPNLIFFLLVLFYRSVLYVHIQ